MALFYDDFERADGAIGNNWTTQGTAPTISGGKISSGNLYTTYQSTLSDGQRIKSACHVYYNSSQIYPAGPAVKIANGQANCYYAHLALSAGVTTFYLRRGIPSAPTTLASTVLSGAIPSYFLMTIEWNNGTLTAVFNGTTTLTAEDNVYAGQNYAGVCGYFGFTLLGDCLITTGAPPTLAESPAVIGNYGSTTTVTLTGTGTAWTAGTPGTPVFTVDHGTITAQEVTSATSATLTYNPGSYLGAIVFTDPSTTCTASALVTSDINVLPPGTACPFTEDAVAMVNDTADHTDGDLTTSDMIIIPAAENLTAVLLAPAIADLWSAEFRTDLDPPYVGQKTQLLSALWQILNGSNTAPIGPYTDPGGPPLAHRSDLIKAQLDTIQTSNDWTLGDVIVQLAGEGIKTHLDILNAIGDISGGDNQDVLDKLDAMWGTSTPTLTQIATMVGDLATISGYTLGDVLDAVNAIPATDLGPVLDKLDAIQPSASYTLSTVNTQNIDSKTVVDAIKLALVVLTAGEGEAVLGLLDILTAIDGLANDPVTVGGMPPVWPGLENVDLWNPYQLGGHVTITSPMDGVLIDITGTDLGVNYYLHDDLKTYRNCGTLMFLTDNGYAEGYQLVGREKAIYTPTSMFRAVSVKIHTTRGLVGTITPWTIK